MKKVLFFIALCACANLFSQTTTPTLPDAAAEKVYEAAEVQEAPQFPGGERAMNMFLANNILYPVEARKSRVQGKVTIAFIIRKDGSVTDAYILKDIGKGCGKASLKVVKSMPKWIPGKLNGVPVDVKHSIPVSFGLG